MICCYSLRHTEDVQTIHPLKKRAGKCHKLGCLLGCLNNFKRLYGNIVSKCSAPLCASAFNYMSSNDMIMGHKLNGTEDPLAENPAKKHTCATEENFLWLNLRWDDKSSSCKHTDKSHLHCYQFISSTDFHLLFFNKLEWNTGIYIRGLWSWQERDH